MCVGLNLAFKKRSSLQSGLMLYYVQNLQVTLLRDLNKFFLNIQENPRTQ